MNILIISHYFLPHYGGIENVVYNQAKSLTALGHKVTIVTSDIPKGESAGTPGFTVIRVPALSVLEDKFDIPYPIFGPRLIMVLRQEIRRADVIHAHGHVFMPSVVAAALARRYKRPLVLTQHNTFVEYRSALLRGIQRLADISVGKYTLRRSARVLAVSPATRNYIESICPANPVIHYNGVSTTRFRPADDRAGIRRRLSIPPDMTVCLCVRRITFKNGIDTLLDTADLLRDRADVIFVICGSGPGLETVRQVTESRRLTNVRIVGKVADDELPMYYAASDIFILPSKTGEGFPLVILEALASGLPVIATRSGGHAEFLEGLDCGYIIEPERPRRLADEILNLANDAETLAKLKLSARRLATGSLSWDANAAALAGFLSEARK